MSTLSYSPDSLYSTLTLTQSPRSSIYSTSPSDTSLPSIALRTNSLSSSSSSSSDSDIINHQHDCLPTRQLFDLSFPETIPTPSPSPPSPESNPRLSISISSTHHQPLKRPSSTADHGVSKKPRSVGERTSTKDFVPPDVSGLSKREARLVKNRAAAFLSRQRKREEFESMEIRVVELERENARLLAITQNRSTSPSLSPQPADEEDIERLRAQLAAAQQREQELCEQLARKSSFSSSSSSSREDSVPVKPEPVEPQFIPLSPQSSTARSLPSHPHKSSASLGLMVLLCTIPTLLSVPNTHSTSFLLASPSPSSPTIDFNPLILNHNNNNDYSGTSRTSSSLMDLDGSDSKRFATLSSHTSTSKRRKLEFVDGAFTELNDLDVSFETSHADDGRIRVRIHSPGSSSSSGGSEATTTPSYNTALTAFDPHPSPISALSHSAFSHLERDPFLGATGPSTFGGLSSGSESLAMSWYDDPSAFDMNSLKPSSWASSLSPFSSSSSSPLSSSSPPSLMEDWSGSSASSSFGASERKRHVRIALKSMPTVGGEGGEWEVQIY